MSQGEGGFYCITRFCTAYACVCVCECVRVSRVNSNKNHTNLNNMEANATGRCLSMSCALVKTANTCCVEGSKFRTSAPRLKWKWIQFLKWCRMCVFL